MTKEAEADGVTLREISVRLTGIVHAVLVGRLKARDLVPELRLIADWIEGGTKPARPAKEEVTTQVELEIFQYWVARFNKPRVRFTPERRQKIRARLRDGYSPDDLKRAIDGCKASPYHNGENEQQTEYNDITLILRTGSKLEGFRDRAKETGIAPLTTNVSEETEARIQELAEEGAEALKAGDVNAYNRTQAEIKGLRSGRRDDGASGQAGGARRASAGG